MSPLRKVTAIVTAVATSVVLLAFAPTTSLAAGPRHQDEKNARTSAKEAARVGAVPTPRLRWAPCNEKYQCATALLPLDYDRPRGRTVRVALLKVPAGDAAKRVGSLFLNPGGPGGSGKGIAERAAQFLSPEVLDRFDLIGMDPRGTNDSTRLQCYPNERKQANDTDVLDMIFPIRRTEEKPYRKAVGRLAAACSTFGQPLASSMSTAEVPGTWRCCGGLWETGS